MAANRIQRYVTPVATAPATTSPAAKSVAAAIPQGFVLCPPHLATANAWQQEIYRQAYQRAQAAVQVPRHYRLLFSVWN